MLKKLLERLRHLGRATHAAHFDGFLSREAFAEHLLKERARADRTEAPFALVKFSVDVAQGNDVEFRALEVLASVLSDRVRLSDTKGWFEDCLAVAFPDTTSAEIPKVWRPILDMFNARVRSQMPGLRPAPVLSYEAYAYPDDQVSKSLEEAKSVRIELKVARSGNVGPDVVQAREA